jgi:small multidrug resistance family-3 protein
MERLLVIGSLFVAAGLCEIGGGYLVWGWMRDHKPLAWALLGALVLAAYGVVAGSRLAAHLRVRACLRSLRGGGS